MALPICASSLRNGTTIHELQGRWNTDRITDLPLCPSSGDCNSTLACTSDPSLFSRRYCRRQKTKRRTNPPRTATEAITSAAITAGRSGPLLGSSARDVKAESLSALAQLGVGSGTHGLMSVPRPLSCSRSPRNNPTEVLRSVGRQRSRLSEPCESDFTATAHEVLNQQGVLGIFQSRGGVERGVWRRAGRRFLVESWRRSVEGV